MVQDNYTLALEQGMLFPHSRAPNTGVDVDVEQ